MLVLSSSNRQTLLHLAFESIRLHFDGSRPEPLKTSDPELLQTCGCFVTLRKEKALRGCIGTFDTKGPLIEKIPRLACEAAFQDSRFEPLARPELRELRLEISILSAMREVTSLEEVEIGRHGVHVSLEGKSGTLLPDVALEHGMSREQFVLCCAQEKARLKPEEIARARLAVYEVMKFSGTYDDQKG